MIGLAERLAIKKEQGYHPATDGRVGKVEDRAEENEMLSSHKRHPLRPIGVDDGKIKHVYHLAIEQGGISSALRHKRSDLRGGAFVEQHAIEDTVHDVAQRTRQDEGDANDESCLEAVPHALVQEPSDDRHCHQPEDGEKKFPDDFHAEGHPHVFGKENIKPICHPYAFVPIHVGLDPYLDDLVYNQYGQYNEPGDPAFGKKFVHLPS